MCSRIPIPSFRLVGQVDYADYRQCLAHFMAEHQLQDFLRPPTMPIDQSELRLATLEARHLIASYYGRINEQHLLRSKDRLVQAISVIYLSVADSIRASLYEGPPKQPSDLVASLEARFAISDVRQLQIAYQDLFSIIRHTDESLDDFYVRILRAEKRVVALGGHVEILDLQRTLLSGLYHELDRIRGIWRELNYGNVSMTTEELLSRMYGVEHDVRFYRGHELQEARVSPPIVWQIEAQLLCKKRRESQLVARADASTTDGEEDDMSGVMTPTGSEITIISSTSRSHLD